MDDLLELIGAVLVMVFAVVMQVAMICLPVYIAFTILQFVGCID